MNNTYRLRIGLALTILIGVLYTAIGLLDSLTHFSIGAIITSLAVIGYGALDYCEARRDDRIYQQRLAVWARRDTQDRL